MFPLNVPRAITFDLVPRCFTHWTTFELTMPGRCPFYRWQKAYLAELVEKQLIVIHPAVLEVEDDAPRNDAGAAIVGRNILDEKVDKLIRIVQLLVVMIVAMFAIGVMYVFK
ncbi:hypothetical protein U9M48_039042 [Paspalum notatum var. saurae]|uniref:Uncharacterized protein n=1 Tax=Paspalum notatum var. saurae TaxID=547442 RepID=A0AAQ3UJV0_PASNO